MKKCEFLEQRDISLWHNDIFDHPSYEYFCKKNMNKLEFHELQCLKCKQKKNK